MKLNSDIIPAGSGHYIYPDNTAVPGTVYEYRLDMIEASLQVGVSTQLTYWPYSVAPPILVR